MSDTAYYSFKNGGGIVNVPPIDELCETLKTKFEDEERRIKYLKEQLEISKDEKSMVEHPSHYAAGRKYEPIDVIEDWDLGFSLGNVVKYISRAGRKNDALEDLNKAKFYLQYAIDHHNDKNG